MSPQVAITASGPVYQAMAAAAARTYQRNAEVDVVIQIPDGEVLIADLAGLPFRRFPWTSPGHAKPWASLKIAGWAAALQAADDLVLLVDADTCCQRPLEVPEAVSRAVRIGAVAAVPDREPHWPRDTDDPWHVPEPLPDYVNSGVLLLSEACAPVVERCAELAASDALFAGQYGDQRVLNYLIATDALCVHLPADWNAIRPRHPHEARILHFAGGGGDPASRTRQRKRHARACARALTLANTLG